MTDSVDTALAEGHVRETVRRHSFLFVVQGVLMVVAGVVAFIYPLVTTLAVTLFLGWMMIISGIVQAITLSPARGCRTSGCSCSRPCSG